MLLMTSERFADHVTPSGHPERVERARVMASVAAGWEAQGGRVSAPEAADDTALGRVHAAEYLAALASTRGRRVRLDPDTHTSPDSEAVARLAAGASLAAVDHALAASEAAAAFVRPPGHHAERNRAMGFCLYNNVAIAAAHARARGLARVAIVDYDVHHGNGTQWSFYDDPDVLFVSTHQYPFYPGTGAAGDVGAAAGEGRTLNIPLAAGAGDADYALVFREAVLPGLDAFAPELVLVSAGFDAHARDPLGGMGVSTGGYSWLTAELVRFADRQCRGRLVALTEGGYDLEALEACLRETLVILDGGADAVAAPGTAETTGHAEAALEQVRRAHASFGTL